MSARNRWWLDYELECKAWESTFKHKHGPDSLRVMTEVRIHAPIESWTHHAATPIPDEVWAEQAFSLGPHRYGR